MSRLLAYGYGGALVVAVVSPVFGDPPRDSYPLSTYPMFSERREKPTTFFVEGVGSDGTRLRIPADFIANDEVMQAVVTVRRAVENGREAMHRLCETAAERVADDPEFADIRRLEIVSAVFDPITYFTVGRVPELHTAHHRCRVQKR